MDMLKKFIYEKIENVEFVFACDNNTFYDFDLIFGVDCDGKIFLC